MGNSKPIPVSDPSQKEKIALAKAFIFCFGIWALVVIYFLAHIDHLLTYCAPIV